MSNNSFSSNQQPSGMRKSQYDLKKEMESKIPMADRIKNMGSSMRQKQEEDQFEFRNKFNKMKMLPNEMMNMRGAVSSPSIASSYSRIA
jgi:hypothetical protein